MFFNNKLLQKDVLLKGLALNAHNCVSLNKIVIAVHIKRLSKLQDYIVLQSMCLLDTVAGQKPMLRSTKCKLALGARSFSYSCKVTLRKKKLDNFIKLLESFVFSEMKRRHIMFNNNTNAFDFTFSINNVSVFKKLDEFYFKWNHPLLINTKANILPFNFSSVLMNLQLNTLSIK